MNNLNKGNLIVYEKTNHIIDSIILNKIASTWINDDEDIYIDNFSEYEFHRLRVSELLDNFGFNEINNLELNLTHKSKSYVKGKLVVQLDILTNKWNVWIINPINNVYIYIRDLIYPHELQNLFYNITGEKLLYS